MDCAVNDRLFTNSLRLTSGVASCNGWRVRRNSPRERPGLPQRVHPVWNRQDLEWLSKYDMELCLEQRFVAKKCNIVKKCL